MAVFVGAAVYWWDCASLVPPYDYDYDLTKYRKPDKTMVGKGGDRQ
jgi:hypothetical protein